MGDGNMSTPSSTPIIAKQSSTGIHARSRPVYYVSDLPALFLVAPLTLPTSPHPSVQITGPPCTAALVSGEGSECLSVKYNRCQTKVVAASTRRKSWWVGTPGKNACQRFWESRGKLTHWAIVWRCTRRSCEPEPVDRRIAAPQEGNDGGRGREIE